jgi:hypothetical protein
MAELLSSVEFEFSTDFAIMNVMQAGESPGPPGGFAGSVPGGLGALCGAKYSRVSTRLERWSAAPPLDNSWDDMDELPFEALDHGGLVQASGFDQPPTDEGLSLDGFETGRVRVLARGRHRYYYGGDVDYAALPREEWLLQFFPASGHPQPLAGGPRRLAGPGMQGARWSTGWTSALHAWTQTGWSAFLLGSRGFSAVSSALHNLQRPVSAFELATVASRLIWRAPNQAVTALDAADPFSTPIGGGAPRPDPLADIHGSPQNTIGDAIAAMRALRLLISTGLGEDELLIPNPAPGFVWESTPLEDKLIVALRVQIGSRDFGPLADDIGNALLWAGPAGLDTTTRELALRWSTDVRSIRGALSLLQEKGAITADIPSEQLDDAPLLITPTRSHA